VGGGGGGGQQVLKVIGGLSHAQQETTVHVPEANVDLMLIKLYRYTKIKHDFAMEGE